MGHRLTLRRMVQRVMSVQDPSQPLKNAKHEAFALARASGKTGAESYREAGYSDDKTGANAGKLTKNHLIAARVQWLKSQTASSAVLSQCRKREILAAIAEDGKAKDSDRIAAIRADNDLAGEGSEAKAADALAGSLADVMARIRSKR